MAKATEVRVSLKFADMAEGGGGITPPDGNYLIKSAAFELSAFGKDVGEKYNLFKLVLLPVDAKHKPAKGVEPAIVFYSFGDVKVFKPSADGDAVVLVDPKVEKQISKNCLFGHFIKYGIDAGFDDSDWEGNASRFNDMVASFRAIDAPKYDDLPAKDAAPAVAGAENKPKKAFAKKIFIIEDILVDPGSDEAPVAAKSKKAKDEDEDEAPKAKKGKGRVEDDEDIEEEKGDGADVGKVFAKSLKAALKGKKTADRAELRIAVYKGAKNDQDVDEGERAEVATKVNGMFKDDKVLGSALEKLGYTLDGDEITED